MGPDHVWMWPSGASRGIANLQGTVLPDHALRALNGVGATVLDTPVNTGYNAALQAFQQDKELQQYYIDKQVRRDSE